MKKNIFVIGDLIIDHTVFVKRRTTGEFEPLHGEHTYKIFRQQYTAGGAANNARILSVLSDGKTYLWGILGKAPNGTFHDILEFSQSLDGGRNNIELRGVQDETDARMDTITRFLVEESDGKLVRSYRFDDVEHVHVHDSKRNNVLYHLDRVYCKSQIDAIVINDLDKRCLTKNIVDEIAKYANEKGIPLFIDPKRDRSKYKDIRATAVLPNLVEWCHLVDDENRESYWRENLDSPDKLEEMAHRSFRYLKNFVYHIITCDKDGAVIIAPHPKEKHLYAVYRIKPEPISTSKVKDALGCGDILTAVFALTYDIQNECTEKILEAFKKANQAVACYREMDWHRMPSSEAVQSKWSSTPIKEELRVTPSKGMLFLPDKETIRLIDYATCVPTIYSLDSTFKEQISKVVEDTSENWDPRTIKSIILAAPSGTGKTSLMDFFKGSFGKEKKITAVDFSVEFFAYGGEQKDQTDQYFKDIKNKHRINEHGLLMVDEATTKKPSYFLDKECLLLLQSAHKNGIRFLFIDSAFCRKERQPPDYPKNIISDIKSRCNFYELSGLAERPMDIPYIIAAIFFGLAQREGFNELKVEGKLLLTITNYILGEPNPRNIVNVAEPAYRRAITRTRRVGNTGHIFVKSEDLATNVQQRQIPQPDGLIPEYYIITET